MKILNDLSLAEKGHRLCEEEWIFWLDNAAILNALITKKYLLEQKNKTSRPARVFFRPQSLRKSVGNDCRKIYEGGRLYSAISELKNAVLDA